MLNFIRTLLIRPERLNEPPAPEPEPQKFSEKKIKRIEFETTSSGLTPERPTGKWRLHANGQLEIEMYCWVMNKRNPLPTPTTQWLPENLIQWREVDYIEYNCGE